MKVTALAPWYGSKRTLAPTIIKAIGPHRSYWEPFCGSMAVLLAKEPCASETVCDLNGDITNLARVLASSDAVELFSRLSRTLFCESLVEEAKETRRAGGLTSLDAAYWFFVESWMGRNGVAGTHQHNANFCVRYTSNGGAPACRFRSAIASIPAWVDRLANVTILNRDGFDVIDRVEDKPGTVIYADPPYLVKGSKYVHDFEATDHERLANGLGRFRETRAVVSYYDHPDLDRLYRGWLKIDCATTKAMVNAGQRGTGPKTVAPEVLLINQQAASSLF